MKVESFFIGNLQTNEIRVTKEETTCTSVIFWCTIISMCVFVYDGIATCVILLGLYL